MTHVLAVDDDTMSLEFMKLFLESEGYTVSVAVSLSEAEEAAKASRPDILITDLNLGPESGQEVIKMALALNPALRVFVISGYNTPELGDDLKCEAVFTKPIELTELLSALQASP